MGIDEQQKYILEAKWDDRISHFDKYVDAAYKKFDQEGLSKETLNCFKNLAIRAQRLYQKMWLEHYNPNGKIIDG